MSDPRPSDYAMAIARKGAPLDEERVAFMLDAYAEMLVKRDRERIAIWLRQAELRGRLPQAMKSLEEGRWFTDE